LIEIPIVAIASSSVVSFHSVEPMQ